jgi:hypothetical protein
MPEARTEVQGAAMRRTMAQLVFEKAWVPAGDCFTLESMNFAARCGFGLSPPTANG